MKTYWTRTAIAVFLLAINCSIYGQDSETAIRFAPGQEEVEGENCFDIQVRYMGQEQIKLGTQNYRIFYDASQVRFLRQKAKSFLKEGPHSKLRIIQAVHNSDASGYGNLAFSATIGFINININDTGNPVTLPVIPSDDWMTTSSLCFESLSPEPSIELVWGRKGLTDGYATAFTRISIVKSEKETTITKLAYIDFSSDSVSLRDRMAVSDIKD